MANQLTPEMLASCKTNHGPLLLTLGWTSLAIAIVTVSLRLFFRHFHRSGIHKDDIVMLVSLISGTVAVCYLTITVRAGSGQHIYCLPPSYIPTVLYASTVAQIFNILGIGLVKVSICLTILRLLQPRATSRHHQQQTYKLPLLIRPVLWCLLIFACLSHAAQIILFIVQCRPMRGIWHLDMQADGRATCFSPHITYLAGYVGFGMDAFTDLACATIPVFIIRPLQMSRRKKVELCMLMGLGSLTAACAIAKAVTLEGVFDHDLTFGWVNPTVCTILEHLLGMILASLPTLRTMVGSLWHDKVQSRKERRQQLRQHHQHRRMTSNADVYGQRTSWLKHNRSFTGRRKKGSFANSEDSTIVAASPLALWETPQRCHECGESSMLAQERCERMSGWDSFETTNSVHGWPLRTPTVARPLDRAHGSVGKMNR